MAELPLPPGSMGLPLVGETLQLLFDPNFAEKRFKRHGLMFKTRILGRPAVFFAGPEAVEFMLSSHMDHFTWREGWPQSFKTLLGRSLFVQEGEEHRRNRRLIMPAFHGPALVRYFASMEQITQGYLETWVQKRELVWYNEFKQLTFEIASQIFLGSSPGPETVRLSQLFTTLTNGLFGLGMKRAIAARQQILQHLTQVIQQRQQHPTDDALSLLIQAEDEAGNRLTLEEICDQALLLLFAGHETTTAMLTWACLELARHPHLLNQARAEQINLAPQGTLSLEQISQMPYLDQVISELERCHPPVAGGFRGVVKSFDFSGYHIPAGWLAQYSILHTHRLATVYTDPDRFDPDRFSPERQESKLQPFSLVGFGSGSRICIGLAFAKLEMKLILAHLLRGYQWQLMPNQNLEPVLIPTRRPQDGLRVRFEQRDRLSP
jgi:retinoid hydroxylase